MTEDEDRGDEALYQIFLESVGLRSFLINIEKKMIGGKNYAENHIGLCKQDAEKP